MSLLADIQDFTRNKLRHTSTEVTTIGGRRLKETLDDYGRVDVEVLSEGELGFIGDYQPDLQIGNVMKGLFFGSQDVAANLELLKSHNITHIINMAQLVDNIYPDHFQYLKIDIRDIPESDIIATFEEAFVFIDEGREKGGVFVHCNAGVSRASSLVIGFMMRTNKWDFQKAYNHAKTARPATLPNPGFRKQLQEFKPT